MSTNRHVSPKPWPVIINVSLSHSEVRQLLQKEHKVRVSDTTGEDTVIFPLSSVAFLLLDLDRVMTNDKGSKKLDIQVIKRLERFQQIHRHCYVIVVSQMMSTEQLESLVVLQGRFLDLHLGFIPVHNPKEIVDCMISIAKVTCKPLSQIIQERLQNLQSSTLTESVILHVLSNLGLTMHAGKNIFQQAALNFGVSIYENHKCFVLHDGCQTIANIVKASIEELMDCSLDHTTAKKIITFFEKDYIGK